MKKITLSIIVLFTSISTFAQFQTGNMLVSGTFIFGSSQSKSTTSGTTTEGPITTTFEIGPGLEYFLSGKFTIGGEIDYSTEKEVDNDPAGPLDETINKTSMTTLAPFASYYFINEERFALFCKLGVGFGFGKNVYETKAGTTTVTDEVSLTSLEIGLKPGVAVHLSEKFGMTATFGALGFTSYKSDDGTTVNKDSEYGLKISPSLGFGIYFKLK